MQLTHYSSYYQAGSGGQESGGQVFHLSISFRRFLEQRYYVNGAFPLAFLFLAG
jgi:hypothetical protein